MKCSEIIYLFLLSGGGPKPKPNKTYDIVLDVLDPIAKDGIVNHEDGETDLNEDVAMINNVAYGNYIFFLTNYS